MELLISSMSPCSLQENQEDKENVSPARSTIEHIITEKIIQAMQEDETLCGSSIGFISDEPIPLNIRFLKTLRNIRPPSPIRERRVEVRDEMSAERRNLKQKIVNLNSGYIHISSSTQLKNMELVKSSKSPCSLRENQEDKENVSPARSTIEEIITEKIIQAMQEDKTLCGSSIGFISDEPIPLNIRFLKTLGNIRPPSPIKERRVEVRDGMSAEQRNLKQKIVNLNRRLFLDKCQGSSTSGLKCLGKALPSKCNKSPGHSKAAKKKRKQKPKSLFRKKNRFYQPFSKLVSESLFLHEYYKDVN